MLRITAALAVVLVATATWVYAQQIIAGGRGGRFGAPKWAVEQDFDGTWLYCRGFFNANRREGGGSGWGTDYPAADNNFSVRLAELTRVNVKLDSSRQPNFVVVPLNDPLLYKCPILFMEDVGVIDLSPDEITALRDYFLKGGLLWVDDYWGSLAWDQWEYEIGRVLPGNEFPIFDIPATHPVMQVLYAVPSVPQVPNIGYWRQSGGDTSERGPDSRDVHFRGIQDAHGRLMVVMSHNTDIADTWEREGENHDYFSLFSPRGYALGVNIVLYAMTH
jgi:hypothetical protein